jgi:hypothetical protein
MIDPIYSIVFSCHVKSKLLSPVKEVTHMAVSAKYGKLSIPKVGDDEPVFILRAQDKLAEPAIAMYQILASYHGAVVSKDIHKEIESFRNWKGTKKLPD